MYSLSWNDITLCFSSAFDSAVYILKCLVCFKQLHEQFNFLHQRWSFVYSNYEHMVKKSPYDFNDNGDIWITPKYHNILNLHIHWWNFINNFLSWRALCHVQAKVSWIAFILLHEWSILIYLAWLVENIFYKKSQKVII